MQVNSSILYNFSAEQRIGVEQPLVLDVKIWGFAAGKGNVVYETLFLEEYGFDDVNNH